MIRKMTWKPINMGMKDGMVSTFEKLDELLATIKPLIQDEKNRVFLDEDNF